MSPFKSPNARKLWGKACNFHRGSDREWECGNPSACNRRLSEATREEEIWLQFVEEWA